MDTGHWTSTLTFPEEFFGFIYKITNTTNNKCYIGKKQAVSRRKLAPLKGKKRKRIVLKESDWKTYTGSSASLLEDIETLGKDKFIFDIIRFCGSKWELAYYELKEQVDNEVLISDDFYNGIINVRIGRPPASLLLCNTISTSME